MKPKPVKARQMFKSDGTADRPVPGLLAPKQRSHRKVRDTQRRQMAKASRRQNR